MPPSISCQFSNGRYLSIMEPVLVFGIAYLLYKRQTSSSSKPKPPPHKTSDVVVVGASNMDLITYCQRCPHAGETIHGYTFQQGFGGKGANQAVMSAKLGAKTNIITCVGNDSFGDDTVLNFTANGLECSGVLRAPGKEPTGVAPIWVDAAGENRILIVNGANDCLLPQHVQQPSMRAIISAAKVLICQLEIKSETTLEALKVGKLGKCLTILNPAPASSKLDSSFYAHADIIAPNQTEAYILTGIDASTTKGAKKAGAALIEMGVNMVVMTLGKDGALVMTKDDATFVATNGIDASLVKDTSGAGDCFLGAFAYHLTRNTTANTLKKTIEAAKYACSAATLSVQRNGTQSSYPDRQTVDAFCQ